LSFINSDSEEKARTRKKDLYSSLIPYAMTISGSSVKTALAAAFMRSSARLSFGFSKAYLFENLELVRIGFKEGLGEDRLVESSSIDSDYDPCVGEEQVRLLEGLYVFVSVDCQWVDGGGGDERLYLEFAISELGGLW
jgi:hypothetical protein